MIRQTKSAYQLQIISVFIYKIYDERSDETKISEIRIVSRHEIWVKKVICGIICETKLNRKKLDKNHFSKRKKNDNY